MAPTINILLHTPYYPFPLRWATRTNKTQWLRKPSDWWLIKLCDGEPRLKLWDWQKIGCLVHGSYHQRYSHRRWSHPLRHYDICLLVQTGNQTQDLWIRSPMYYPLHHKEADKSSSSFYRNPIFYPVILFENLQFVECFSKDHDPYKNSVISITYKKWRETYIWFPAIILSELFNMIKHMKK